MKPRVVGVPNTLSEDVLEAFGLRDAQWGPCMKALPSDRHRAFVCALYEIERGLGATTKAAKMAGFGTSTTSAVSWRAIAYRLAHDDKILAAIHEEDQRRIRTSAPRAIRALTNLVEDPDHKDHGRAIAMILDRVHPAETHHTVEVRHHIDHDAEAVTQLRMLKSLDVSRAKLEEMFGHSGLSHYERLLELEDQKTRPRPKMIEGTAVEIRPQPEPENTGD
jgi:hypothetical protein